MAAQLTAWKAPLRPLQSWSWRAKTSFPVPLSPSRMMLRMVGAMRFSAAASRSIW